MKLRSTNKQLTVDNLHCPVLIFALVSVVLRCIQIYFDIDPENGFYNRVGALTWIFYLILAVCCVGIFAASFLSRQTKMLTVNGIKNKPVAALSLVIAIFFLTDAASARSSASNMQTSGMEQSFQTGLSSSFQAVVASGAFFEKLRAVLAVFSAVFFVFLFYRFLKGAKTKSFRIIALAPVGWTLARLLSMAVSQISFLRVSDLVLNIACLCLLAPALMALAQSSSGVYDEQGAWRIPGAGLSFALLALTANVPRLIFSFAFSGRYLNEQYPCEVLVLLLAAFFLVIVSPAAAEGEKIESELSAADVTHGESEQNAPPEQPEQE